MGVTGGSEDTFPRASSAHGGVLLSAALRERDGVERVVEGNVGRHPEHRPLAGCLPLERSRDLT